MTEVRVRRLIATAALGGGVHVAAWLSGDLLGSSSLLWFGYLPAFVAVAAGLSALWIQLDGDEAGPYEVLTDGALRLRASAADSGTYRPFLLAIVIVATGATVAGYPMMLALYFVLCSCAVLVAAQLAPPLTLLHSPK